MSISFGLDSALRTLEHNPTIASLLKEIWPSIETFDFSKNQVLEVAMPHHEVKCGEGLKVVPYSHFAIRRALRPLGLEPVGLHGNKNTIRIKQSKHSRKWGNLS